LKKKGFQNSAKILFFHRFNAAFFYWFPSNVNFYPVLSLFSNKS